MSAWWWRLAKYARQFSGSLILILIFALTGAFVTALTPWPLKLIIDSVLGDKPLPAWTGLVGLRPEASAGAAITWLALASLCLVLAGELANLARNFIQAGVGSRMTYAVGGDLFAHIQRMSLLVHFRKSTGDLVRRVTTDASCAQDLLLGVCVPLVTAATNLIVMASILFALAPAMAMIAFATAIPLALALRLFSGPMTRRAYAQQQEEALIMSTAERALTSLPVVQAFGREDDERRRFARTSDSALGAHLRLTSAQIWFAAATTFSTAVGTAVVLGVGGMRAVNGELTLGTLVVILAYLVALYTPLETLVYLSSGFYAAGARAKRVFEIMELSERVHEPAHPIRIPGPVKGRVRFDNVTFGYDAGKPVLEGISFAIAPGESLALVGPTGAGKTSIGSLLLRLYDPWSGRISIDDVDAPDVALAEWRNQIAFVPQDPLILPVSIKENIAYGRPGASDEDVYRVARMSQCAAFIEALPNSYDTIVGERGATLSGGEKQRLAIARALLRESPIVLLDEPTSALDAETESNILKTLGESSQSRTTIVIAHRLSTIRNADRILFLERGRVVEAGTYQELIARKGRFYAFEHVPAHMAQGRD